MVRLLISIHIYLDGLTKVFGEHPIHKSLVCGTYIFKPERHNFVTVEPPVDDERGVFFVGGVHVDLFVPRVGV